MAAQRARREEQDTNKLTIDSNSSRNQELEDGAGAKPLNKGKQPSERNCKYYQFISSYLCKWNCKGVLHSHFTAYQGKSTSSESKDTGDILLITKNGAEDDILPVDITASSNYDDGDSQLLHFQTRFRFILLNRYRHFTYSQETTCKSSYGPIESSKIIWRYLTAEIYTIEYVKFGIPTNIRKRWHHGEIINRYGISQYNYSDRSECAVEDYRW